MSPLQLAVGPPLYSISVRSISVKIGNMRATELAVVDILEDQSATTGSLDLDSISIPLQNLFFD
jgi:hypothetical protein